MTPTIHLHFPPSLSRHLQHRAAASPYIYRHIAIECFSSSQYIYLVVAMIVALAPLIPFFATAYASPTRFQSLLLTPTPPHPSLPDCIADSYHGQYAGQHAFILTKECPLTASLGLLDSGTLAPLLSSTNGDRIVWVGPSNALTSTREEMMSAWDTIDSNANSFLNTRGDDAQTSFSTDSFQVALDAVPSLIHVSDDGLYLSVPNSILPVIDTFLPSHMSPVAFPPSALSIPSSTGNDWDVPEAKAAHLANITKHLRFNPTVEAIASSISAAEILEDIRWLTGERKDSTIVSRHSFHPDTRRAVVWLRGTLHSRRLAVNSRPNA